MPEKSTNPQDYYFKFIYNSKEILKAHGLSEIEHVIAIVPISHYEAHEEFLDKKCKIKLPKEYKQFTNGMFLHESIIIKDQSAIKEELIELGLKEIPEDDFWDSFWDNLVEEPLEFIKDILDIAD